MTQGQKRKGWEEGESSAVEETEESSCGEEDTESEAERRGEGDRGEEREHKCVYEGCGAVFRKVGKLNRHILSHTGERPFACTYPGCDKRFTRVQHLKRHGVTHTGDRPFACTHEGCDKTFTVASHLSRHMKTHQMEKPYKCTHPGCNEAFTKQNQLKRHMCVHTNGLPYVCSHEGCGQSFNFPSLLDRHVNRHHLGVAEKQYMCGEAGCGEVFDKHSLLRAHIKEKHPSDNMHACTECDKKYKRKKDLETHMGTHFPDQRKLFYCKEDGCNKSFISDSNLKTHIRSAHAGEKSFVCTARIPKSTLKTNPTNPTNTTDNTTADTPTSMDITNTTHEDEPTITCGQRFAYKHALERHMKTHSKLPKVEQPKKKKKTDNSAFVAKIVGVVHLASGSPPPSLGSPSMPMPPTEVF